MKAQAMVVMACVVVAMTAAQAQQSPNWQLNAPYACADGNSYTITKRVGSGNAQTCFWTQRHNGRFVTNAYSRCFAMIGRLRGCKVGVPAAAAPAKAAIAAANIKSLNDTRYSCPGRLIMSVYQCRTQGAQSFCYTRLEMNGAFIAGLPKRISAITKLLKTCRKLPQFDPAYLVEFPSAYRVARGMVIGNPLDNAQRAIGAYYQLGVIVRTLAGGRSLTPEERKLLGDYGEAQSELERAAAKKFPGQRFDLAANPFHYPRSDPKFGFQGIPVWTAFLTPGLQSRFARIVGGNDPRYMAAIEQKRQVALERVKTAQRVMVSEAGSPRDAGRVAMRRCMESGRSDMECLGEGLKTGIAELAGASPATALASNAPAGLRLSGVYSHGPFNLGFDQSLVVVHCGSLEPQSYPYSVQRAGFRVLVRIPIRPRPLVLSYGANGDLAGPGAIDVAGRIVIGPAVDHPITMYQSQMATTSHYLAPGASQSYNSADVHRDDAGNPYVNAGASRTSTYQMHNYTVPTAPKTERCNVGNMPPTGKNPTISGVLTRIAGTHASRSANSAPGLRLGGTYASPNGLKIEFRGDSATLVCGQARNSEGYAVVPSGARLVVKFQNNTGPFSLVLQPNGSLSGAGTVQVTGRRIYKTAGGQIGYMPFNSHCIVGTLTASR